MRLVFGEAYTALLSTESVLGCKAFKLANVVDPVAILVPLGLKSAALVPIAKCLCGDIQYFCR